LEEDKVGWHVPPSDPEKLLKKIYQIYEEREKIRDMGSLARRIAIEKYSVETAIERYKKSMR
jgi:glycosyltransferase involved in cell wall biosynthesis